MFPHFPIVKMFNTSGSMQPNISNVCERVEVLVVFRNTFVVPNFFHSSKKLCCTFSGQNDGGYIRKNLWL